MQSDNIAIMETAVKKAAEEGGADMIALPECWNGPYSVRTLVRLNKISCSETVLDCWTLCMGGLGLAFLGVDEPLHLSISKLMGLFALGGGCLLQ